MSKGIRPLSCEVLVCVFSNMCMVINAEINGIIQLLWFHLKFTIAVSWLSAEHFTDHRFAALGAQPASCFFVLSLNLYLQTNIKRIVSSLPLLRGFCL